MRLNPVHVAKFVNKARNSEDLQQKMEKLKESPPSGSSPDESVRAYLDVESYRVDRLEVDDPDDPDLVEKVKIAINRALDRADEAWRGLEG
jgi:hypothetical protein